MTKKGPSHHPQSPSAPESAPPSTGAEQPSAKIAIQWDTEPPAVYANFASVHSRQEDFAMVFSTFSPQDPIPPAEPGGRSTINARITASVRMTPSVFIQLLMAMGRTWNKYVDTHLPPDAPVPHIRLDPPPPAAEEEPSHD